MRGLAAACLISLSSVSSLGAVVPERAGVPEPAVAEESPVADAAMRGDLETVKALLASGADVNEAQGDGMTALHWAAKSGRTELATLLIEAGADVGARTRIGAHQPLHVASAMGHGELVRALLTAGADPSATTETGATALHYAAASGSDVAVTALVDHGADPNAREPEWGQTPLMFAAAAGRVPALVVLLAAGADPAIPARVMDIRARNEADQADSRARRARMAALADPPRAAEAEARAQAERIAAGEARATGAVEESAAEAAARRAYEAEQVDLQEEPEPLGYADLVGTHGGLTPLLLAAREGQDDAVFALLDGGAELSQGSAADGTTALLIATINGYFDLAMRLIERGADVNAASSAGATALYGALNMHWAPKARHPQPTVYMQQETSYLELMTTLLDKGADVNARLNRTLWYTTYNRDLLGVDRTGATPFWRAAHALDLDAMKLLLSYGADPGLPTLKIPERSFRRGDTTDHSGLPPIPLGGPAVYPIHAASGVGHGQGFAGNSHRHVPDGWLPTVRFLVEELGADVNRRDHNGYSPVHHAAARGDTELIRYLVEQGADVTVVARNGRTTVDMANGPVQRVQPYPEAIALLESLGAKNNHNCVSC